MCGENCLMLGPIHLNQGSPPHVRGKLGLAKDHQACHRITPACAGKTDLFLSCVV